jgi:hypothetical protein
VIQPEPMLEALFSIVFRLSKQAKAARTRNGERARRYRAHMIGLKQL